MQDLTAVFFILFALLMLGFIAIGANRRLRRESRASQKLPWRTNDTVRAEQARHIHDRGTHSAEPHVPERERRPLRPGADNVKRFN